jgi:GDP-4-dehydro-6-deoxy-D-mannose reductase
MIKVFITGASGFVGRHLIHALRAEGKTEYDIYGTCFPEKPSLNEKNLFHLNIKSSKNLGKLINDIKPDWVFHLAAISNVRQSWEKRRETLETNIIGTFNILESLRMFSPKSKMLFVSSSEVYDFNQGDKQKVTEKSPLKISNPYAYSKVADEKLCEFYAEVEKLDVIIARPFPHTGPGQSEDFVCSDWAKQIAEIESGKKPAIIQVGNLDVIGDYCDVRDVVKAYILLLKKGRRGEIYNICSGRAISLRKILKILIEESPMKNNIKIEKDQTKLRKVDMPVRLGSNKKIKNKVGWKPEISINCSLKDLLEYWRQRIC